MKNPKVILVHGAYGYPDENWFGWMKQELQACGIPCQVPQFPTPVGQSLKNWLAVFNQACGNILDSNTILIGHSLGAAFILRWLELPEARARLVILVGAFLGEVGISKFDSINKDFFSKPFNWQLINEHCDQYICYQGSDDPYVSKASFYFIADQLQAKRILISKGGHLNAAAGYDKFPQLLIQVKQFMEES